MRRRFLQTVLSGITSALVTRAQSAENKAEIKNLTTDELKELVESREKYFFLDVREPKELEELGTIKGYVNIPMSQLESRLSEIPKDVYVVTA